MLQSRPLNWVDSAQQYAQQAHEFFAPHEPPSSTTYIYIAGIVVLMYVIQTVNFLAGQRLNNVFGVGTRNIFGIPGIVTSPLFHGGWGHLLANTVPFVVLGALVAGAHVFTLVTAVTWVASGIVAWLIGARGRTVGMSGVIFGYFGYLVTRGVVAPEGANLWIAIGVFVLYGSMIWGVLPKFRSNISWQGHLGGAVGGGMLAWALNLAQ